MFLERFDPMFAVFSRETHEEAFSVVVFVLQLK